MSILLTYAVFFVVLLLAELLYFRIADKFNIIDKPNQRSSHTKVVIRGGGILFAVAPWIWAVWQWIAGDGSIVISEYGLFLIGLTLIAGVSFVDDVRSLPDSVRLVVQFVSVLLMLVQIGMMTVHPWWMVAVALVGMVVCVGAIDIYNFMDGINGITAGYSLAVLVPLLLVGRRVEFVHASLLMVVGLAVLVFCMFNFRPKNKAKCFAGDVGSISIAFILLFAIGLLVMATGDVTWLIFLLVYGVDGCCTIVHRIMLHENLGEAHRKHAFQLMANELGMSHIVVSLIYMGVQMVISLGFIYLVPDTVLAHWIYLIGVMILLAGAYVLFMKKYYHLHEEYLARVS